MYYALFFSMLLRILLLSKALFSQDKLNELGNKPLDGNVYGLFSIVHGLTQAIICG